MAISLIMTTYNAHEWLEKVLWGFQCQTYKDFELLVADDGSGPETAELVKRMQAEVDYELRHVWHEDNGFRKCEILNKAIIASKYDYIVFTDGDCIPREDFLQAHVENRREGHFLSGGAIRLPMNLSRQLSKEDIFSQRAFDKDWLTQNGLHQSFLKSLKLTRNKTLGKLMNAITPTNASWNGGNASAWRKDIFAVNGFNEVMRYGAQDREFGERLMNKGLKGVQLRYAAICLHLDHSRAYKNQKDIDFNKALRAKVRAEKISWTAEGLSQHTA